MAASLYENVYSSGHISIDRHVLPGAKLSLHVPTAYSGSVILPFSRQKMPSSVKANQGTNMDRHDRVPTAPNAFRGYSSQLRRYKKVADKPPQVKIPTAFPEGAIGYVTNDKTGLPEFIFADPTPGTSTAESTSNASKEQEWQLVQVAKLTNTTKPGVQNCASKQIWITPRSRRQYALKMLTIPSPTRGGETLLYIHHRFRKS